MNPRDAYNQMADLHGLNCHCVECIPPNHIDGVNGHDVECFCDLCNPDVVIGFTSCTCGGCDIEGEAHHRWNIMQNELAYERIVTNLRLTHGDDCTCSTCGWLHAPICPVYIHGDDGHWLECQCRDCYDGGRDVDHCTCPKCDIAPKRDIMDPIAITRIETMRRIIEIRKESHGYSVSAISKFDGFTGEITFTIDLKEAEEELLRYKHEDERCAIPPPTLQKKLDPIPYESDDENGLIDFGQTSTHIIGSVETPCGVFEISAIPHDASLPEICQCAETREDAAIIFDRFYAQYRE